ncbi:MAG: hypothetical protein AB8H79_19590 [Myxococcota bacterium]
MTTTVIASRHHATLMVAPLAGPALDKDALTQVLHRHGLRLIDGTDLATAHEFIAAEDVEPAAAAALAEDLRSIGLHARVVNRTGLTGSRRVGQAIATQLMTGMVGLSVFMMSLLPVIDAMKDGDVFGNPLAAIPLGMGVLAMGWAAVNGLVLQQRGGSGIRLAGKDRLSVSEDRQLTDQLSDLLADLPPEMSASLMERARELEVHARNEPEGRAAAELRALVDEIRNDVDADAAQAAVSLREEVARARRAIREAQKG